MLPAKASSIKIDDCESTSQIEEVKVDIPVKARISDKRWGWMIVLSSFMMNFLADGVSLTFGLFSQDLVKDFDGSIPKTQFLNSVLVGTCCMMGPIAGALTNRYGCRIVAMAGTFIGGTGLLFSSFSRTLDIMIFWYAIIGGIGFGLMMLPSQVAITYHFKEWLSFSNGIAKSGSGIGGFVFAPLSVYLLEKYKWRHAIRIISGLCLSGTVFASWYYPIENMDELNNNTSDAITRDRKTICSTIKSMFDVSVIVNPVMWIYGLISFLLAFGYFIPYNFLPSLAEDRGLTVNQSAVLIMIISISNTVMRILIGLLGDQPWADSILIHGILLLAAGVITCLMPSTHEFIVLTTYSVIYGSAIASFCALKPSILLEVLPLHKLSNLYGMCNAFQGVALILGSPISGWLMDVTGDYSIPFYVSGASICLSGILSFPLRRFGK